MVKNDAIFVASEGRDIIELNHDLETIKTYRGTSRHDQPTAMDANEEYLVLAYEMPQVVDGDYGHYHQYDDYVPTRSIIDIKGRRDNVHGFQISEVNLCLEFCLD